MLENSFISSEEGGKGKKKRKTNKRQLPLRSEFLLSQLKSGLLLVSVYDCKGNLDLSLY